MKKTTLLIFLLSFATLAFAAPPTVDFNFSPAVPLVGETILFQPTISFTGFLNNMQWQFDTDGNVNYFGGNSSSTLVDSSFDTNFSGWTINEGSFSIVSNRLKSGTVDSGIYHAVTYPSELNLFINTRMALTTAGRTIFCFNEATNAPLGSVCTNYGIWISSSTGNIELRHGTTVLHTLQSGFSSGNVYDINMVRTMDGNFSFTVDGVGAGSVVDNTSQINGNYIQLGYGASGGGSADFGYTSIMINDFIDSTKNETHIFNTASNKLVCLTAGNADGNSTTCHTLSLVDANVFFSGYRNYDGNNYVHTLSYDVNYSCGGVTNLQRKINDTNNLLTSLNCDGGLNNISVDYTNSVDGPFNIKLLLVDQNFNFIYSLADQNFISDITAPLTDLNNSSISGGFSSTPTAINLNLTCTDTISPVLDYNVSQNSINIFSGTFLDGNTQIVVVDANLAGELFLGSCTDLGGNTSTDLNTFDAFINCFQLVDEQIGTPLTTGDVNSFGDLIAVSYLTGDVFDFKSPLATEVCFTSAVSDTIRFDMNYSDGTQIFREFNQTILLNYDQNIPVCIADLQSFYEQDFTSARNTPVILRQQISQCYNAADYTKYAEGDALSLRAFTVIGPYYMETFDTDGNKVVLSQINGGAPSGIQIDVLKFKLDQVPIQTVNDFLGVSLLLLNGATDSNTLKFFYLNYKEDNIKVNIQIADNNGTIFDYNELTSPNAFVFYFDHTLVPIDGNFLTVTLIKTKENGSMETETRIISLQGDIQAAQGIFGDESQGLAAIFAVMIFLFGFTMVGAKYALGWVGIMVTIISLIVLTLSSQAWYIIWLQAIFLIIGIYLAIVYKDQHAAVT